MTKLLWALSPNSLSGSKLDLANISSYLSENSPISSSYLLRRSSLSLFVVLERLSRSVVPKRWSFEFEAGWLASGLASKPKASRIRTRPYLSFICSSLCSSTPLGSFVSFYFCTIIEPLLLITIFFPPIIWLSTVDFDKF